MIKLLQGVLVIFALLTLSGCSKKIYTHQQVMQGFHNKDQVLKHFGMPDQVKEGDGIEEWVYNRDAGYSNNKNGKQDTIIATNAISDTLKAFQKTKYTNYIRFIFDPEGNVVGYKTNGVDLTVIKKDSFGITLLKVLGVTALIVIVVGLDFYSNSDINL